MNKIFCPITIIFVLASIASAQDPLSVEVSIVDVTATVETVHRTTLTFGEASLQAGEIVTGTKESQQSAALVTTSEPADVQAFSADLELANVADAGDNRYLVTGKPGRYMLVIDTGERNKLVPVVIPGVSPPDKPDEPDKPPVPDLESLAESSATLADKIDDPPTRRQLAEALDKPFEGDFQAMKVAVDYAIDEVLLFREGDSLKKPWLFEWRKPLSEEMHRLEVDTAEEYSEAIKQITKGLKVQSVSARSVPLVPAPVPAPVQAYFAKPAKKLVPIVQRQCGPLGVCRDVVTWVEVWE